MIKNNTLHNVVNGVGSVLAALSLACASSQVITQGEKTIDEIVGDIDFALSAAQQKVEFLHEDAELNPETRMALRGAAYDECDFVKKSATHLSRRKAQLSQEIRKDFNERYNKYCGLEYTPLF